MAAGGAGASPVPKSLRHFHCGEPAFDVTLPADTARGVRCWLCAVCGQPWDEPEPLAVRRRPGPPSPSLFDGDGPAGAGAGDGASPAPAPHPGDAPDPMHGIHRARRRWRVRFGGGRAKVDLGLFPTLAEAQAARDAALGAIEPHARVVAAAGDEPRGEAELLAAAGVRGTRRGYLVAALLAAGWLRRVAGGLVRGPRAAARPAR